MGLTANVVANAPILSAWGNEIRDRSVQVFSTVAERSAQWTAPPTGAMSWVTTPGVLSVWNGTAWVCITPQGAVVATSQSTGSVSYTDLTTVGPAVSIQTGTKARVTIACSCSPNTIGQAAVMSFGITGATTVAAADATSINFKANVAGDGHAFGGAFYVTGLTPGVNTFTAKYKVALSGLAAFAARNLTVEAIP